MLCFLISLSFASAYPCFGIEQDPSAPAKGDSQSAAAPSGKISGHVYRADSGQPIPKAIVTLFVGGTQTPERATRTDVDGGYSFSNVEANTYSVEATHSGYADAFFREANEKAVLSFVVVTPGQTRDKVDFRLGLAGVISGRITDSDGELVEGLPVFAIRPSYSEGGRMTEFEIGQTRTDDRGEYRIAGLKPGTYLIRAGGAAKQTGSISEGRAWAFAPAYFPGFSQAAEAQAVRMEAGAAVEAIDLQVVSAGRDTYRISAHIPGMSKTIAQISVLLGDEAIADAQPFWNYELKTAMIAGLPAGKYTIVARVFEPLETIESPAASNPSSETRTRFPFRLRIGSATASVSDADASVSIQLGDAGQLRGKLVIEKTKNPDFSQTDIDLEPLAGIGSAVDHSDPQVEMQANGAFTITNILPGSYFFRLDDGQQQTYLKDVVCNGKEFTQQPIEIEIGTYLEDCRVTISSEVGTIAGTVFDGDKPLSGLYVVAIPQSRTLRENPQYTSTEKTDADGHFEMKTIPGDYFLFAVRPNDQDSYYALDFADRNLQYAERVSVKAGETKIVTLKPTTPQ